MEEKSTRKIAYITVAISFGGLILFLFFKYLFLLILPFLLAWTIAFLVRGPAGAIGRVTKLPRSLLRAILSLVVSLGVLAAIGLGAWALGAELWRLLSGIGEGDALRDLIEKIMSGGLFTGAFAGVWDSISDLLYKLAISAATELGSVITGWVAAVPGILLFILITVIASVYFALDLERINATVRGLLPKNVYSWVAEFRRGFFSVGLKYIRSYLFLMLITFTVMLVGLVIMRRPYALLLSFVIALLDVLPVIGVGTVIIPWSVYELVLGDGGVGAGLIILFIVYELIRQFAEPKIVGANLGVHPIITLACLYIGYSLFGFVGILLVPIATVLINITLGKKNSAEVEGGAATEHNRS